MVTDRQAMFSHITMFLPFQQDGKQSAAVHIQSRKNNKGQLDEKNCRLLFDLQMSAMGPTVIDVQVVERIVSLKVHNDHPAVAAILEQSRQEIASQLEGIGYQFSSLKIVAFPVSNSMEGIIEGGEHASSSLISTYAASTYKGVDL